MGRASFYNHFQTKVFFLPQRIIPWTPSREKKAPMNTKRVIGITVAALFVIMSWVAWDLWKMPAPAPAPVLPPVAPPRPAPPPPVSTPAKKKPQPPPKKATPPAQKAPVHPTAKPA